MGCVSTKGTARTKSPARRAKLISPAPFGCAQGRLQRWVSVPNLSPEPLLRGGTIRRLVGLDVRGLQHCQELLLKRTRPMMRWLVGDVLLHAFELGRADAERSVSLLPCKRGRRFPHQAAGVCLEGAHSVGQCRFCRQNNENVDVVCSAAHGENVHPVIARDSGDVVPQIGLAVGRDQMLRCLVLKTTWKTELT